MNIKNACLAAMLILLGIGTLSAKKKPNIIFLIADDQCYNTIHALGHPEVITPNLDKMVNSGVTFTHAYNMGGWNGAICAASRAMFNTGRSMWRANKNNPLLNKKQPEAISQLWGNVMQRAGYETYMAGKWHVQAHPSTCFKHVGTVRGGMPRQTPEGYNRPKSKDDNIWKPWDEKFGGFWAGGKHWSEVLADEAIGFIDDAKDREDPFFMYIAFNAPHDPRQSPKRFVDMYPVEDIAMPKSFLTEYPDKDVMGAGKDLRDEKLAPFPRTEYAVKVNRQEYYAIITHMDEQIGRILEALEASGEKDNTYIFYTADHGLSVGHHGLLGKQSMYDHSMRSPLIVIGPDLPKNERRDMDVYIQDIMPSTLEVAGVEKPEYVEFSSLMPMVTGKQKKGNMKAVYGAYREHQRMVRKDGFKLIVYPKGNVVKLFDLNKDPEEMNNLAADPKYAGKIKSLQKELHKQQQKMGDELVLN